MTPYEFIAKWRASELKERSAAQEHFIDLCRLLDEPTPAEADPTGGHYCFERGARKDTGGDGWADVWKRHHFAWEYKGPHANLDAAFTQLRQYALALENPPLLIVSDMLRFRIYTNWTNSVSRGLRMAGGYLGGGGVGGVAGDESEDGNLTLTSVISSTRSPYCPKSSDDSTVTKWGAEKVVTSTVLCLVRL